MGFYLKCKDTFLIKMGIEKNESLKNSGEQTQKPDSL
jgi:hypothetical protein